MKSLLVLDKSRATVSGNKYTFQIPHGVNIRGYRVKEINIPSLSSNKVFNNVTVNGTLTNSALTTNTNNISTLQSQQQTNTGNIGDNTNNITTNTTSINSINAVISTDTERINAVTALTQAYSAADTTLNNTLTTALTTKLDTVLINTPYIIHVDSNNQNSYTADGSFIKPYKSLSGALNAKLTDNNTETYIFKLAPGEYVGAVSIDKTQANQSFTIEGSGKDVTIIKGSNNWDSNIGNVLYFRDFNEITLRNCTVQYGAYGFYPRNCEKVIIENVKFLNNGSEGTVNRHDLSGTQQEQAAYWASSSTSNGGACRIRNCEEVCIYNCEILLCARGLRIQDCGTTGKNSIVTGCKVYRTLESGIYLAAGSYNGTDGCENFLVSNNIVEDCFNNGLLCIGGKNNTFLSNNIIGSANAGIQSWHSLDLRIKSNSLFNCNKTVHNGVGAVNGDAFGNIVIDGNTNIGTGSYMAIVQNNSMIKCNQGGANSIIGIHIKSSAYPQASNKIIIDNNNTDATTKSNNPNNIPETSTSTAVTDPQTATNTTNIATNAANIATNTSNVATNTNNITTNSNNITTNTNNIANKQNALTFGNVTDQNVVVYSQNIKSYIDNNSSGGGDEIESRFDVVENGNISGAISLTKNDRHITWLKSRTLGEGGLGRYKLPNPADIEDGHTISFYGFAKSWGSPDEDNVNGGAIRIEPYSNQESFQTSNYEYYDTSITASSSFIVVQFLHRKVFYAHWDSTDSKWWVHVPNDFDLRNHDDRIEVLEAASGGALTGNDKSTSSGAKTLLELENTGTNGQVEFILADIDPSGDVQDHRYRYITQSNCVQFYSAFFQNHNNIVESLAYQIGKNGNISFHGASATTNANFNAANFMVRGTSRFFNTVQFDNVVTMNNNLNVAANKDITIDDVSVQTHFKYFASDDTTYQVTGNAYYQLPANYSKYIIVYGNGLESNSNNTYGVRIRLPVAQTIKDGTCVVIHSNHNFNTTSSSDVVFITWNSDGGEPSTRKIIENDAEHTIQDGDDFSGEMRVESFSNASGRGEITYTYVSSIDTWIYKRGSY